MVTNLFTSTLHLCNFNPFRYPLGDARGGCLAEGGADGEVGVLELRQHRLLAAKHLHSQIREMTDAQREETGKKE